MAEKSVIRAMQLLELLAASDESRGVSELSRQLKWTKSGTHRLLTTLTQIGYVRRIETSQTYRLSHKLLQLASRSVQRLDLRQTSLAYLQRMLTLTGETSRLTILVGRQAICIEQVETRHPVTLHTQVGGTLLLSTAATGKAILAFQDTELIESVAANLKSFNERTLSTRELLLADLELIRQRGFAINHGEQYLSVSGVGAPVRDRAGKVEAAIGISGPSERLPLELLQRYGPQIRQIADELSEEMGWTPGEGLTGPAKMSDLTFQTAG